MHLLITYVSLFDLFSLLWGRYLLLGTKEITSSVKNTQKQGLFLVYIFLSIYSVVKSNKFYYR